MKAKFKELDRRYGNAAIAAGGILACAILVGMGFAQLLLP